MREASISGSEQRVQAPTLSVFISIACEGMSVALYTSCMKKLFFLIAAITFSFMKTSAQEFMYQGLKYAVSGKSGTCIVVGYEEGAVTGHLAIPSEALYNGKTFSVTEIIPGTFSECTSLTSVNLPESLVEFPYAFEGCTSLESVKLSNSIATISAGAFNGCTALSSVELPESLKVIEDAAFSRCSSLPKIDLPDNVNQIKSFAFQDCISLSEIHLPAKLNEIQNGGFSGCFSLKEIDFPFYLELIGEEAFAGCSSLERIDNGWNIKEIESYAFYNCSSLQEIVFPSLKLEKIGSFAFQGLTSLHTICFYTSNGNYTDIPVIIERGNFKDSPIVRYIEENRPVIWKDEIYAKELIKAWKPTIEALTITSPEMLGDWKESPQLRILEIYGRNINTTIDDDYIRTIPEASFAMCPNLTSVGISGVDSIGVGAFCNCPNLEALTMRSVKNIGEIAFADCFNLREVNLPSSLKKIDHGAFQHTPLISAPNISDCYQLEYIGDHCFSPYNNMSIWEEISIPGSVQYLGKEPFWAKSVTLQQGIGEIGEMAFPYVTNMTVENLVPPAISEYNFLDDYPEVLTVPEGSREAYASTTPWNNFKEIREERMTMLSLANDSVSIKPGEYIVLKEAVNPNLDWNYFFYSTDPDFEVFLQYDDYTLWGGSSRVGDYMIRVIAYDGNGHVKAADCKVTVTDDSGVDGITSDSLTDRIKIYDINGVLIYTGKLDEAVLSPGIYIAVGNATTKKIRIK